MNANPLKSTEAAIGLIHLLNARRGAMKYWLSINLKNLLLSHYFKLRVNQSSEFGVLTDYYHTKHMVIIHAVESCSARDAQQVNVLILAR